ncbi:ribosomal L7Ae/L30e/S12e/Gadd45 family protein [Natronospora cellulosivora (SeqCode)]
MLAELNNEKKRVVGKKQTLSVIKEGKADKVFLAEDVEKHIYNEIYQISKENKVIVITVDSRLKLGRACGIDVSAACAALLK